MVNITPVLQSIEIEDYPHLRERVLSGEKEVVILAGFRPYKERTAMICSEKGSFAVRVDITSVHHCPTKDVTQAEWDADGYLSQNDLLQGLREHDESQTLGSPVTVIRWTNVSGDLVDEYREHHRPCCGT